MTFLDLFILALIFIAVVRGVLQGAVMQIFPFGGFWLGLLLGSALAPFASRLFATPSSKAIGSIAAVFVTAIIFSTIGRTIGGVMWRAVRRARLGTADAALGALVAGIATLFAVWLLAMMFAGLPFPQVAKAINRSAVIKAMGRVMPPAPSVFSRVRQLIGANNFPDVFAELEPPAAQPVQVPTSPEVRAAVSAARNATVKVTGAGCGGIKSGSGFVATLNLVVTNAHVVAGIDRPDVIDRAGRHRATTVLFDPKLDIAVLRVGGLGEGPLPVRNALVDRGTGGAVLGYPGGGPFQAGSAAVMNEFRATGRDIYGEGLSTRRVYQLRATVRPGNSGGPFVRTDGEVLGVVFSASATDPDIGYAITSPDVAPRIQQATNQRTATDTGPCTA
jgi:S1-C subfamily serine protease